MRIFLSVVLVILLFPLSGFAKKIIVEAPSLCCEIEKVVGNAIYLIVTDEECPAGRGYLEAEVSSETEDVVVYVNNKIKNKQKVDKVIDTDRLNEIFEKANELAESTPLPKAIQEDEFPENAVKTAEKYKVLRETVIEDQILELAEEFKKGPLGEYFPEEKEQDVKKSKIKKLKGHERLYVFISRSIPMATLQNYAVAIESLGDPRVIMVLKGMSDSLGLDRIDDALNFSKEILKKNADCFSEECQHFEKVSIEIDPRLFSRYSLKKVPAFVYTNNANSDSAASYLVYGDFDLAYMLEKMNETAKNNRIDNVISALKNNFYN